MRTALRRAGIVVATAALLAGTIPATAATAPGEGDSAEGPIAPVVSVATTDVTPTSVELTASVDPVDAVGTIAIIDEGGSGADFIVSDLALEAGSATYTIEGLTPSTDYSFAAWFLADPDSDFIDSRGESFTVTTAAPIVPRVKVEEVGATTTSVDLKATVNPSDADGVIVFSEYGAGMENVLSEELTLDEDGSATFTVDGLESSREYTYMAWFIANKGSDYANSVGIVDTRTATAVSLEADADAVSPTSMELTAAVKPANADGTITFSQVGVEDDDVLIEGLAIEADGSASYTVTGLTPATGYSYVALFVPTDNTEYGNAIAEFSATTDRAIAPAVTVETLAATTTSVDLKATVDPADAEGMIVFSDYGVGDEYVLSGGLRIDENGSAYFTVTDLEPLTDYRHLAWFVATPQTGYANSVGEVTSTTTRFVDVPSTQVFFDEITWLAAEGISTGWEDGTFRPYQPVLRDQMAAFLYRMAGEPEFTAPDESPFRDVPTTHVFYDEITWLAAEEITTGWELEDGVKEFRPYEPVLRDQMAAFLYRMADGPEFEDPEEAAFADVPESQVFYTEIEWLADTGVTTGWDVGEGVKEFRPYQQVLRDQMAAFLNRMADMELIGQ